MLIGACAVIRSNTVYTKDLADFLQTIETHSKLSLASGYSMILLADSKALDETASGRSDIL